MKILLNFSTLKNGGGQNVALNFLNCLMDIDVKDNLFYFLVVKDSIIHNYLESKNQNNIFITSASPFKRSILEYFKFSNVFKKHNIDIIYTYFGYGLFRSGIPQVCGIAVSNIFYPDMKFWNGNFLNVLIHKAIDLYRIYGVKNADALIFENNIMQERCHRLYGIIPTKTIFIAPSFSPNFFIEKYNSPLLKKTTIKLLMLCGWQLNKNIFKVPEIAYALKKYNIPFQFIITAPNDNSKIHLDFMKLVMKYNVTDMISIVGTVKKQQLESLYSQIDYVLLMSKLESFSNNIIESWYYRKPLIVSNEEWALSICQNAALYVNRDYPANIADSIYKLHCNSMLQTELVEGGISLLTSYPTIMERTKMEIDFLEKIYNEA
jgi:glycosyltransferase involved in cell wall biosynthesis